MNAHTLTLVEHIMRTDFFPGLGWMLSKRIWRELRDSWPAAYWDDWLRHPSRMRGRSCLIPEITRTLNFGKEGVSQGQYFEEHIRPMSFLADTETPVDFGRDVAALERLHKGSYDEWFLEQVYSRARLLDWHNTPVANLKRTIQDRHASDVDAAFRLEYRDAAEFAELARAFGLMDDVRVDVSGCLFSIVLTFGNRCHGRRTLALCNSS